MAMMTTRHNSTFERFPVQLAFSTLGCPEASLNQIIEWAAEYEYRGIELRADDGGLVSLALSTSERALIKRRLSEAKITLLALASYVKVCSPEPDDAVIADLRKHLQLASDLGAAGMRVFPGAAVALLDTSDMAAFDRTGARRLSAVAAEAAELGVRLLLETHDSHPRGSDVVRILSLLDGNASVGVIWDAMHPWRYGESPEETARLLAGHLAYAQVKDGVIGVDPADIALCLPGDGEVPLREIVSLVEQASAEQGEAPAWISLEWEKAWYPELPALPRALAALRAVLER